jgi:hypothetical protein
MPSHRDLDLIFFFRIANDLATVNQHIVLEKWIQSVAQKVLVLPECPGCFEKWDDLLSHTFQKTTFEAPEASQDMRLMIGMIANDMGLVMRLFKFTNGPTISTMDPTIGIPNHHEFHPLFVQG